MMNLEQVVEDLEKIHRPTAEQLKDTIDCIETDDARLEWARQCLTIAGSGWHAYESAIAYIRLSPLLVTRFGIDELLKKGAFGVGLSGYSFEPGHTYFVGLESLLTSRELEALWPGVLLVENAGGTIHQKYEHASNLITDYFNAAFKVLRTNTLDELKCWQHLVMTIGEHERSDLTKLLKLSELQLPWSAVLTLQKISVPACISFIESYPELERKFGKQFLDDLQPLLVKYLNNARDENDPFSVSESLRRLLSIKLSIHDDPGELLVYLDAIEDIRLAGCLVNNYGRLPQGDTDVISAWVQAGVEIAKTNFEAAQAFFNLESSRSIDLLNLLKGQANFSEYKRVLQLYAEAISGIKVRVESGEEAQGDYRELPQTDGLTIFLPEHCSQFSTKPENFGFYKAALLHQLGYFEFGTFARVTKTEKELSTFDDQILARNLFRLLEDARIDWQLEKKFRGAQKLIQLHKVVALEGRVTNNVGRRSILLEAMIRFGLDATSFAWVEESLVSEVNSLVNEMKTLQDNGQDADTTLEVLKNCYQQISSGLHTEFAGLTQEEKELLEVELPEPVSFHGEMDTKQIALNMLLAELEETVNGLSDEDSISITSPIDLNDLDLDELTKGDVQDGLGMLITDLENIIGDTKERDSEGVSDELKTMVSNISRQGHDDLRFYYDEWDHTIDDYRRRWCTLFEIQNVEEEPEYVQKTLSEHRDLSKRVRKQLNMLKPEMLVKIKGVPDGDEMDIERVIEAVVDRKTGFTPSENIFVERQRKDRDVSALFLLDMSASTDDIIPDPDMAPEFRPEDYDDEDFLTTFHERGLGGSEPTGKRIIDLEKESVILMAEALEELGDNYSVCGFSGYGRERVDYFLCKDFTDSFDQRAKGRIGGIKPSRSTRMGPAIRHATRSLVKTESRIKALIIISDGYPQDFDYGQDRGSKDYGVQDTTKALSEARLQGVQSFCLTVDPSGHDYLREMCPDQQYMVIQDIKQLPDELSKVYRSLTG
jgi:hypothetical protein